MAAIDLFCQIKISCKFAIAVKKSFVYIDRSRSLVKNERVIGEIPTEKCEKVDLKIFPLE